MLFCYCNYFEQELPAPTLIDWYKSNFQK